MAIRNKNKDQRPSAIEGGRGLELAQVATVPSSDDPLVFWTNHPTENSEVDLRIFATGQSERPNKGRGIWSGPFTGRPKLIAEIAPHLRARLQLLSPGSAKGAKDALRLWWRMLDYLEENAKSPKFGKIFEAYKASPIKVRVDSIADLHELHAACARQWGLSTKNYGYFVNAAEDARRAVGLPCLAWIGPEEGESSRSFPDDQQARQIKQAIKSDWRAVLQTWLRNDTIVLKARARISGQESNAADAEEERLIQNAIHYQNAQAQTGLEFPRGKALYGSSTSSMLSRKGLQLSEMRGLMHPTAWEADVAFHLCALGSGWNPSTVGRLDALDPSLVRVHPKKPDSEVLETFELESDDERAEISAVKPRAHGATQFCTGLLKDACSPPAIVRAYRDRSAGLRRELLIQLEKANLVLRSMVEGGVHTNEYRVQFKKVQELRRGVRCVWLYLDRKGDIAWLEGLQSLRYFSGSGSAMKRFTYLQDVVKRVNEESSSRGLPEVKSLVPSDFRDLFARWVYQRSGGDILAVMLALGHRSLRSTQTYLEGNVYSDEADESYMRFAGALIDELGKGRLDLTILAQIARNGPLTSEMKDRLEAYRKLMKSRTAVACQAPRQPPIHIEPEHVEGRLCGTQRCLLDCENARFLPESLEGIAMRLEELAVLQDVLPRQAWLAGMFEDERDNAQALLSLLFPEEKAKDARQRWRAKIEAGLHLIPEIGVFRKKSDKREAA